LEGLFGLRLSMEIDLKIDDASDILEMLIGYPILMVKNMGI